MAMLLRFNLYGFLKNQQYFEPFWILVFLDKGLSFTEIGFLIGFREICVNLMEIPAGVIADLAGRRRAMILSFVSYIVSFVIFTFAGRLWLFFAAMLFFGIGRAFRTGTHKAMIFDWLERQGKSEEKTKFYGLTRSWSKLGSAVSVVIASVLIFTTRNYSYIFALCIIPYAANIVNFLTYPAWLDGPRQAGANFSNVMKFMLSALKRCVRHKSLRRLLVESMAYEGTQKATKDYLQPLLQHFAAIAMAGWLVATDHQRTAIAVGAVYLVLHLLGSYASRHAGGFVRWAGSERKGMRYLWVINLSAFVLMSAGIIAGFTYVSVIAFVVLAIAQNFWRPIMIGQIADRAGLPETATVLSVESQAKSLFTAAVAPLVGLAVDLMPANIQFLPVGILGLTVSACALLFQPRRREPFEPTH